MLSLRRCPSASHRMVILMTRFASLSTAVPMGRVGAVDLIQHMARRLVFRKAPKCLRSIASRALRSNVPVESLSFWVAWTLSPRLKRRPRPLSSASFQHSCGSLVLPPHAGQRVVRASSAFILGAELDGSTGVHGHRREKSNLPCSGGALYFCSRSSSVCADIADHSHGQRFVLAVHVVVEVVILHAPVRSVSSSCDASQAGGGATEASFGTVRRWESGRCLR